MPSIQFQAMLDQEELHLSDKFIGDDKIPQLCAKLKSVQKKKLILRGNNLGPVGAQAVADFIADSDSIQQISLEWNLFGNAGAEYIAHALETNRSLVLLDLKNNSISSDGAAALADAIMRNNVLTTLDLRWNQIDDRGALAFKSVLLDRHPRLTLLLTGNLLSESTVSTINAWTSRQDFDVIDLPKHVEVPRPVQQELLSRDIVELRQQIAKLHETITDLQCQGDKSSMRVAELEMALAREEYRNAQLQDQVQQALLRASILTDEKAAFLAAWEKERADMVSETLVVMKEKEAAVRDALLELDALQNRFVQLEDDHEQLKIQNTHLQDQLSTERDRNQHELRLVRARMTEYSISESKLKAEQTTQLGENNRLAEKIKSLEEGLRLCNEEAVKQAAAQDACYKENMLSLQENHALTVHAMVAKNETLSQDIQTLQAIVCTLRGELETQKRELEEVYDAALKACRQAEQDKCEQTTRELKQRVDMLSAAKAELEQRCEHGLQEITSLQKDHESTMARISAQLQSMQSELQRLREQNASQHTQLTASEGLVKGQDVELRDLQRRLQSAEDNSKKWIRELQTTQALKQKLSDQLSKLQEQYSQIKSQRELEFAAIRQNIVNAVASQFEQTRVDLGIQDTSKNT